MVHICEFTADLIHHGKLKLDPGATIAGSRPITTPATGRSMGLLEEPRSILKSVCRNFHEMPENTIASRLFAAARALDWARTKTWKCVCAAAFARQRREIREGKTRRQFAHLHLRHRQGYAAHAA